jgi:hypothetical protein
MSAVRPMKQQVLPRLEGREGRGEVGSEVREARPLDGVSAQQPVDEAGEPRRLRCVAQPSDERGVREVPVARYAHVDAERVDGRDDRVAPRVEGLDAPVVGVADVHQQAVGVVLADAPDQRGDPRQAPALGDLHVGWSAALRRDAHQIQVRDEVGVEIVHVDQRDGARVRLGVDGRGGEQQRHQSGPQSGCGKGAGHGISGRAVRGNRSKGLDTRASSRWGRSI